MIDIVERTGRKAASRAALSLGKPSTTKVARSVAAGALSREPKIMRSSRSTAVDRSLAASALSPAPDSGKK